MNRNRKLLCWIGSIMLSLSQAEIIPEPIARFTIGEDTLAEETLLSRGQYPILGSEIGARFIFHRQSTLWTLLNFDSPSSGCVSPSNMRAARSNLSVGGRMIVNPSLLIGAYIQGETLRPFVEENVGTLTDALLSPLHANTAYSIGFGVDGMFLHPIAKGLYPLQVALGGHYTLSDPDKPLYQTLLAYDKAGATLKVAVEYSKWFKYYGIGHYHYHGGKVSTKPDIQHNTGTALGVEYRLNTYVSLVLQGEWSVYAGYYGRAMLHLNVLGSQVPTNRSLQSYLKSESPRQIAPMMFVEELHNTPGSTPAAEEITPPISQNLQNKYKPSSSAGGTVNTRVSSYYGGRRVRQASEAGSYTSTKNKKLLLRSEEKPNFLRLLSGSSASTRRKPSSSYPHSSELSSLQENTRGWLNNLPTLGTGENDQFTSSDVTLVNSSSGETTLQTRIHTFLDCLPALKPALKEAMKAEDGTDYPEELIDQIVQPMDAIVAALPSSRFKKTIKAERRADKRISSILNILTKKQQGEGIPSLSTKDRQAISEFARYYEQLNAQYSSHSSDTESSDTDDRGRNTQSRYTTTSSQPDKVINKSTSHRSSSKHPTDKKLNRDSSRRSASRAPAEKRSSSKARVRDDSSDRRKTTSNQARSSSKRPENSRRNSSRAPAEKRSSSKARVRDDSSDRRKTTSNQARSSSKRPENSRRNSSRAPTGGWVGFLGTRSTDSSTLSSTQHGRTDSGVEPPQRRVSSRAPQKQSKDHRSNPDDSGSDKKKVKMTVSFPTEITDNQEEADPKTPRDVTPYGQRTEDSEQPLRFMEAEASKGLNSDELAALRVNETQQALSKAQRDAKKPWKGMHSKISNLPYLQDLPGEKWNSVKSEVKVLRQKVEKTDKFKKWKQQLIQTNESKRGKPYALTYEDCIRFLRKHVDLLEHKDKESLNERIVPALTLHIVQEDKQSIKPELADIHQQAFSHKKPSTTAAVYYDVIQNAAEDILTDAENKELLDLTFSILMRIPNDRKFLQDQNYVVKKDEIARAAVVKQIREVDP